MNIIIFILLSILYLYLFYEVWHRNHSLEGLKASLILFILQLLSYIGNFLSGETSTSIFSNGFIHFSGNLINSIAQNFLVIISLIIVIIKYKEK